MIALEAVLDLATLTTSQAGGIAREANPFVIILVIPSETFVTLGLASAYARLLRGLKEGSLSETSATGLTIVRVITGARDARIITLETSG